MVLEGDAIARAPGCERCDALVVNFQGRVCPGRGESSRDGVYCCAGGIGGRGRSGEEGADCLSDGIVEGHGREGAKCHVRVAVTNVGKKEDLFVKAADASQSTLK